MLEHFAEIEPARVAVFDLVLFARGKGVQVMDTSGLIPVELTVLQLSQLMDELHGIDREQLAAEHAAQLQPGAECACGE
jgi:hypothetical protein